MLSKTSDTHSLRLNVTGTEFESKEPSITDLFRVGSLLGIEPIICEVINDLLKEIDTKIRFEAVSDGNKKYIAVYTTEELKEKDVIKEVLDMHLELEKVKQFIAMSKDHKAKSSCAVIASLDYSIRNSSVGDFQTDQLYLIKLKLDVTNIGLFPIKLHFLQQILPPVKDVSILQAPQNTTPRNYNLFFNDYPAIPPTKHEEIFLTVTLTKTFLIEYMPTLFYVCNNEIHSYHLEPITLTIS